MTATDMKVARVEDLLAHADWLRRLASRLVHDVDPDDLVQETWRAALRSPPAGDPGQVRPWLAKVLRNLALTRFRSQRVAARAAETLTRESPQPLAPGPEVLLERATIQRHLADLVASLDEPYRSAILLRYYEGKSAAEIARGLGIPAGTVRWRLAQGVDRLRKTLDQEQGGDRSKWRALLLPLTLPVAPPLAGPGGQSPAGAGGLLAGLASRGWLVLVLVLVAMGGLGGLWLARRGPSPSDPVGTMVTLERPAGQGSGLRAPPVLVGETPAAGVAQVQVAVRDPEGRPVAGAQVTLSRANTQGGFPSSATGQSGADGVHLFRAVAPGSYLVTGSAPDWTAAYSARFLLEADGRQSVTLVLGRDGPLLSGQVLDLGGGPIPGARVTAALGYPWPPLGEPPRRFETTADSRGRYRLRLDPREYEIRAAAPGYADAQVTVAVTRAVTRDLHLQPAARAAGVVVERSTGVKVAGATVTLAGGSRALRSHQVVSDDKGEFTFDAVPSGTYQLFARKGALVGTGRPLAMESLQAHEGLVLEVTAGSSVSGRTSDGQGRALAGVALRLWSQDPMAAFRPPSHSAADGSFVLQGVLAGRYQLTADGSEVGHGQRQVPVEVGSQGASGVELALDATPTISGQVLGMDGRPARGVLVRLESEGRSRSAFRAPPTVTNDQGYFTIASDPKQPALLSAWDSRQGAALAKVEPAPGAPSRHLQLRLARGAVIAGAVRFDDGAPAAAVSVAFTRQEGTVAYDSVTTGDDGRFEMQSLLPGRYSVKATRKTGPHNLWTSRERPDLRLVEVGASDRREGVDLVLPRGGRKIGGVARLPDGSPAMGAVVIANVEENGQSWKPSANDIAYQGLVGDDGRFIIDDVPRQSFTLWGVHSGLADVVMKGVLADRSDVVMTFAASASVQGLVVDDAGKAVADFVVTMQPAAAAGSSTWDLRRERLEGVRDPMPVRDPGGRFLVEGLPAGSYDIKVGTGEGGSAAATVTIKDGQRATVGPLVVRAGVTLTGTMVTAREGKPVAGAFVDGRVGGRVFQVQTDASGKFALRGLPRGERFALNLRADDETLVPEFREVTIPAGGPTLDLGLVRLLHGPDWREKLSQQGRLGIRAEGEPGAIVVSPVRPNSPAARAGLAGGESILSVDGQALAGLGPGAASYHLVRSPGQKVTLVVKGEGGSPRSVELTAEK